MRRTMLERKLRDTAKQLKRLREDLAVLQEQLEHFSTEADDARLRSLVSETAMAGREHRDAERHADAMRRQQRKLETEIERLEGQQDDLLDRMVSDG